LPTNPWPVRSDARFRALRKIFHESIGPRACTEPGLIALQARARDGLLLRLLEAGKEGNGEEKGADFENPIRLYANSILACVFVALYRHIRRSAAALLLLLTYGYEVNDEGYDPFVKVADDATIAFSTAAAPGRFWVDRWPICLFTLSDRLSGCCHLTLY
jgi:hypothetical protein